VFEKKKDEHFVHFTMLSCLVSYLLYICICCLLTLMSKVPVFLHNVPNKFSIYAIRN
jgi:hypothetical protein